MTDNFRSSLIRLASSLPKNSQERKALLNVLAKTTHVGPPSELGRVWANVYFLGKARKFVSDWLDANGKRPMQEGEEAGAVQPVYLLGAGQHDVALLGKPATAFLWEDSRGTFGGYVVLNDDTGAFRNAKDAWFKNKRVRKQ